MFPVGWNRNPSSSITIRIVKNDSLWTGLYVCIVDRLCHHDQWTPGRHPWISWSSLPTNISSYIEVWRKTNMVAKCDQENAQPKHVDLENQHVCLLTAIFLHAVLHRDLRPLGPQHLGLRAIVILEGSHRSSRGAAEALQSWAHWQGNKSLKKTWKTWVFYVVFVFF